MYGTALLSIGILAQLCHMNPSIPTHCPFEGIPLVEFEAGDAPSEKAGRCW